MREDKVKQIQWVQLDGDKTHNFTKKCRFLYWRLYIISVLTGSTVIDHVRKLCRLNNNHYRVKYSNYLLQMNEANDGDNVFVRLCVLSVCAQQTSRSDC